MNNDYFSSLESYSIDMREYCFLMEDSDKYAETFKIYMPKLMPLFSVTDKVKEWRETYSNNIFLNNPECKVATTPSIGFQNYITVHRKRNSWFKYHPSTFRKGTRLLCEIPEKNIRHIRILDDEYNIDNVDKSGSVFVRNPSYEILDKINSGDTVKVSYVTYNRIDISGYTGQNETDSTGADTNDFIFTNTGDERKYVREVVMNIAECEVLSKLDWGLLVSINGVNRHITPDAILGFYKKASEYYSYFQDSYVGG